MGIGWLYPGRETWWGLDGCTQVGRHDGGWVVVPRYGDVVGVVWLCPGMKTWGLDSCTQVGRHVGGWVAVLR